MKDYNFFMFLLPHQQLDNFVSVTFLLNPIVWLLRDGLVVKY
jgi:hypothetical protein